MGNRLGIDLVNNPDRASEKQIAAKTTITGMKYGMFTGKRLDDYINETGTDFYNARQIVNRLDKASKFENKADVYQTALGNCN